MLQVSPRRVRAEEQNGRLGRESVWCSEDSEVSSAKTGVCDCNIYTIYIITKNEVISINQQNYNAHEKSHATEEFVGKTIRQ